MRLYLDDSSISFSPSMESLLEVLSQKVSTHSRMLGEALQNRLKLYQSHVNFDLNILSLELCLRH